MDARCAELLPVPYFHVVFTIPPQLAAIALQNKRLVYGILFRAAAETLKAVAAGMLDGTYDTTYRAARYEAYPSRILTTSLPTFSP